MNANLIVNPYRSDMPDRQKELDYCRQKNIGLNAMRITEIEGRPTFAEMLGAALPDHVNIIANADIVVPTFTVTLLAEFLRADEVFALTRWEPAPGGSYQHAQFIDSQDAWAWLGLPPQLDADFPPGTGGCDNRLAWLFFKAGWRVLNPSYTLVTQHVHASQHRTWNKEGVERIPPPYAFPPPIWTHELPKARLRRNCGLLLREVGTEMRMR